MKLDEIARPDYIKELAKVINRSCKPWLQESQNGKLVLYRGLRNDPFMMTSGGPSSIFRTVKVKKDRRPVDSPIYIHNYYNKTIKNAGKIANRSNSVFTIGSINTLKNNKEIFGEFSYFVVVVPMGRFNYTWSTAFNDGYQFFEKHLTKYIERKPGVELAFEPPAKMDEKLVKSWRGDDGSLATAIRSRREIMLTASEKVLYIHTESYKKLIKGSYLS